MKPVTKKEAENILSDVHHEHHFNVKDGKKIRNLYELLHTVSTMDSDTLKHHMNDKKNDFQNWVYDIVKDTELAGKIAKVKTRNQLIKEVQRRISYLHKVKHEKVCPHKIYMNCGLNEFLLGIVIGFVVAIIIFSVV